MPLSQDFLKTLERLELVAKRVISTRKPGQRKTKNKGGSLEFHDYRAYSTGDETRYIDWNVYARHDELFIKEFSAEEGVHVILAVDDSMSMSVGSPSKIDCAKLLAASLGYISLVNFDSVSILSFDEKIKIIKTFLSGKNKVMDLLEGIEQIKVSGKTNLASVFGATIPKLKGRSIFIIISDLFDIDHYKDAISLLKSYKFQVDIIHILSPDELNPVASGVITILDAETSRMREILLTESTLSNYLERLNRFFRDLEIYCKENEIHYVRLSSESNPEQMIIQIARSGILDLR